MNGNAVKVSWRRTALQAMVLLGISSSLPAADALPFQVAVETYRHVPDDVIAFQIRLEQPFLAGEFETSSYLRLHSSDERAYLIYPKETRFDQRHAEFHGRLRGEGRVTLTLTYETISENVDGSKRVDVLEGEVEVAIPQVEAGGDEVGPRGIFTDWARHQNEYFARMLEYYPHESFYQYCLLQSQDRYGVAPPRIPQLEVNRDALEVDLYEFLTPSLTVQAPLQRKILQAASVQESANRHVSSLSPPNVTSLDFKQLLEDKRSQGIHPAAQDITRLVPADQYLVHFQSADSLGKAVDLTSDLLTNLVRLFMIDSQDYRLQAKLERQLGIARTRLEQMGRDKIISEIALSGTDPFLLEGSDLTVIVKVVDQEAFSRELTAAMAGLRGEGQTLSEQKFNYRGHEVIARYTPDRVISSFVVAHEDYVAISNSHVAIRRLVDTIANPALSLHDSPDYAYMTTILRPGTHPTEGYFYASEAWIRRLIAPEMKISQKRRLVCFNNLVMINNASLFYRLEYGRSPKSLSDLVEGKFVAMDKIVCPHGGAYAYDRESDTCTCSLHNRLRYVTPNVELSVLNVTSREAAEYDRYQQRYAEFWQQLFNPFAVRLVMDQRMQIKLSLLPQAEGGYFAQVCQAFGGDVRPLDTSGIAPSAIVSMLANPGRTVCQEYVKMIPGFNDVIREDPTLTDLAWLGDRVSLHFCDGETILDIDPTQIQPQSFPIVGNVSPLRQGAVVAAMLSTNVPLYVTIDVADREKAERLLQNAWQRIFLKGGPLVGLPTHLDAYQLPDYEGHAIHVISSRVHVVGVRFYVALVKDQLVLATKPELLHAIIDQRNRPESRAPWPGHLLIQFRHGALGKLRDDVSLLWADKSRLACHRNAVSVHNLHQLFGVATAQVPALSEAKYGIRCTCPEGGTYSFDQQQSQVVCSAHGNRENSRQTSLGGRSAFDRFADEFETVTAVLRCDADAVHVSVNIDRAETP